MLPALKPNLNTEADTLAWSRGDSFDEDVIDRVVTQELPQRCQVELGAELLADFKLMDWQIMDREESLCAAEQRQRTGLADIDAGDVHRRTTR